MFLLVLSSMCRESKLEMSLWESDELVAQLHLQVDELRQQIRLAASEARLLAACTFAQAEVQRQVVNSELREMEDEALALGRWRSRFEAACEELHVRIWLCCVPTYHTVLRDDRF